MNKKVIYPKNNFDKINLKSEFIKNIEIKMRHLKLSKQKLNKFPYRRTQIIF